MASPRLLGRAVTALGIVGALTVTGSLPAQAAAPVTPPTAPVANYDDGLFGAPDVFSSAFKQALALLAISTLDESQITQDDADAVGAGLQWLVDQQCPSGGWQGYVMKDVPCGPLSTDFSNSLAYVGEDSNTTAIVVQAFAALGQKDDPAVHDALDYLRGLQQADGGFAFNGFSSSDPNSTSLALQAFLAVGIDPATLTKGANTPYSYLQSQQLDCTAAAEDRGGIQAPFQAGVANMYAAVQTVPALAGAAYPIAPASSITPGGPTLDCTAPLLRRAPAPATKATQSAAPAAQPTGASTASAAPAPTASGEPSGGPSSTPTESASASASPSPTASAAPTTARPQAKPAPKAKPALAASTPSAAAALAASWVAANLQADGSAPDGFGGTDYAGTAYAVMGFAATGTNGTALTKALSFLQTHLTAATTKSGKPDTGALALTALAAFSGGLDPADFGGRDLIAAIEALQYFTPDAPVATPPVVTPVGLGGGTSGSGSAGGSGDLPFTGFDASSAAVFAGLLLLLGAASLGMAKVPAPVRGRHTA